VEGIIRAVLSICGLHILARLPKTRVLNPRRRRQRFAHLENDEATAAYPTQQATQGARPYGLRQHIPCDKAADDLCDGCPLGGLRILLSGTA